MTKLIAWLTGNLLTVAVIGIIAFLVLARVQSCRDRNDDAKVAIATEKVKADTPIVIRDSVALKAMARQLDFANDEITRLVGRIRSTQRQPIPVGTPHDSIAHLETAVKECRDESDSLVFSVVKFRSACRSYRDSATKSIADLKLANAHLDTLLQLGRREKRVQFYGDGLYDVFNRRPVFRVGTNVKTLGSIYAKIEGEYAIPSAVKTESGDGFRLIAGAHLRFW
jgi:hypothetical protein